MSKIFKSHYVNLGQPLEVVMSEKEIKEALLKRRNEAHHRSSDSKGKDHEVTASNIIEHANAEANEILEKVGEQATIVLNDAKIEADTIKSNALKEGYKDGFGQGLEDGKRETEELAHEALRIKEELEAEREHLLTQMEKQIPGIVVDAVNKIIGKELSINKDIIVNIAVNALKRVNSKDVNIKVSDEDFETMEENKNSILAGCKNISNIEITKDLSLDKGDCIVQTDCGEIDASVQKQIDNLQVTMFDFVGNDDDE